MPRPPTTPTAHNPDRPQPRPDGCRGTVAWTDRVPVAAGRGESPQPTCPHRRRRGGHRRHRRATRSHAPTRRPAEAARASGVPNRPPRSRRSDCAAPGGEYGHRTEHQCERGDSDGARTARDQRGVGLETETQTCTHFAGLGDDLVDVSGAPSLVHGPGIGDDLFLVGHDRTVVIVHTSMNVDSGEVELCQRIAVS